ncbi:YqzE family protein [Virgibacillus profundi]|uniref:YqzE family protein n=1 Tax=Virgibacillus profundi TaxID=2024555 RepID=A0A2A2ICY1_9BACI|nr:YqzE family protein [Virgibacillus profundi]PAV29124.1 YqzE family protein [Virgibacillus profundi]PXY53292.1 YqzE family protein [Virgibacillus profundi]
MSGNDYIKFMTEQVVAYIDLPSDERDERRKRKEEQKEEQRIYTNKWLGVLPFAFRIFIKKTKVAGRSS